MQKSITTAPFIINVKPNVIQVGSNNLQENQKSAPLRVTQLNPEKSICGIHIKHEVDSTPPIKQEENFTHSSNTGNLAYEHMIRNMPSSSSSTQSQARRRLILDESFHSSTVQNNRKRKADYNNMNDDEDCLEAIMSADPSPSPSVLRNSSRYDSSLMLLARRFIQMQHSAPDGVVQLNEAATALGTQKRRLYDITNVLEGINMIEKIGKNAIRWANAESDFKQKEDLIQNELQRLIDKEQKLDMILGDLTKLIMVKKYEPTDAQYAYAHYSEVRENAPRRQNAVHIVVRSPDGSVVHVESDENTHSMIVKSNTQQAVDVYVMPDDATPSHSSLLAQSKIEGALANQKTPTRLINESNMHQSPLKQCELTELVNAPILMALHASPIKGHQDYLHYTNRGLDEVLWTPTKMLNPPTTNIQSTASSTSQETSTAELTSASIMSY